jgi:hypothetical protein
MSFNKYIAFLNDAEEYARADQLNATKMRYGEASSASSPRTDFTAKPPRLR